MVPFSLLAQRGCTSHASLALAMSAEFGPIWAQRAEAALDELAAWLAGARDTGPEAQLRATAEIVGARLEALALDSAIDDLLLDRVVVGRAGHPLLICDRVGRGRPPRGARARGGRGDRRRVRRPP
jgi:hypothetical protein